jgi:hypothetical protein
MHDPRVGRFLAVDPLSTNYPWNSSYAFSENRVIDRVELEGMESDLTADKKRNFFDYMILDIKIQMSSFFGFGFSDIKDLEDLAESNRDEEALIKAQNYRDNNLKNLKKSTKALNGLSTMLGTSLVTGYTLPVWGPVVGGELLLFAESGPVWSQYFTSAYTSGFTLNTIESGVYIGLGNFTGQMIANDFKIDENIDFADPIIAGSTGGFGSLLGESTIKLNFDSEGMHFGFEKTEDIMKNIFFNSLGGKVSDEINFIFKPLKEFSPTVVNPIVDFGFGSVIEAGENVLGNEAADLSNSSKSKNKTTNVKK